MSGFDDDYIRHMNGSNDFRVPPPQGAPAVEIPDEDSIDVQLKTDRDGKKWDPRAVAPRSALDVVSLAVPKRLEIVEWNNPLGPKVVAKYNPTEFEAGVETDWNRFLSPGASWAHMHFIGTRNYTIEFELYWVANTIEEAQEADNARKTLLGWCYPDRTPDGWSLGPAPLRIRWPENFRMMCYLIECRVRHLKFALTGRTVRWAATLKFEEASDQFIGSTEVRAAKAIRGLENRPVNTAGKLRKSAQPSLKYGAGDNKRKALRQQGKKQ
jgi:hypothetical protein